MSNKELLKQKLLAQNLTDQQKEAIFSNKREFLLRAAPGSGKTWTSCRRFIWRGTNWNYDVGGLALLSFTNTAIHEFYKATKEIGNRDLLNDPNYVGTLDSFIERFIISPFGHKYSGSNKRPKLFLSPKPSHFDNKKLNAWYKLNGRSIPVKAWNIVPEIVGDQIVYKNDSYQKRELSSRNYDPVKEFFKLGYYTHNHRPYLAIRTLMKHEEIQHNLSKRFPEIIVDEAQDTNIWLLHILNLLHEAGTKITLIGDPDQCIYEFSLADSESLNDCKEEWQLEEKPLSKSFRCNNNVASAVKNIGTNPSFTGFGKDINKFRTAYIYRVSNPTYKNCLQDFRTLLGRADISEAESSILGRGHSQLEDLSGVSNYKSLKGQTKEIARASSFRDNLQDHTKAYRILEKVIRKISDQSEYWDNIDEKPESKEAKQFKLELWKFVKSKNELPSLTLNGEDWIDSVKINLDKLFKRLGFEGYSALGYKIKKTGLNDDQIELPLLTSSGENILGDLQHETIHQAKGKSRDGILLLGSAKFFNSVVNAINNKENIENRRLAYVGMTRARHTLLVGLPENHFDDCYKYWRDWGFKYYNESPNVS